jgi:hypothetical protein
VLAAMEVDVASVCASVPVFWPLLRDHMLEIFVTKEIEITHEDRADYYELGHKRSRDTNVSGRVPSPDGSQVWVNSKAGEEVEIEKTKNTAKHYRDEFVTNQVFPFHPGAEQSITRSEVKVGSAAKISGGARAALFV